MQIQSVDEMKDALRKMSELDGVIEKAEAKRSAAMARANAAFDEAAREATKSRSELEAVVRAFADKREKEICPEGKRSLELAYGKLSWRDGAKKLVQMEGWDDEKVVEAAKAELKPSEKKIALEVKMMLKKAALKALKLGAERLAKIGFEEKQDTTLTIETFPDKVAA